MHTQTWTYGAAPLRDGLQALLLALFLILLALGVAAHVAVG